MITFQLRKICRWFLLISGTVIPVVVFAQTVDSTNILLDVPAPPIPVKANHKAHLLYELHITNLSKHGIELMRIEVFADQMSKTPLVSYDSERLEQWIRRSGPADSLPQKRSIGGGYRAIVMLNVKVDKTALPRNLTHRLFFKDESGKEFSLESARLVIRHETVTVLNTPLRGDGWVAMNGLGTSSHHRLSYLAVNGKTVVPQRYAIDWVKLGKDGKAFQDSAGANNNYIGYGAEVLAVKEATVEETRNGLLELPPFEASKTGSVSFENSVGNHVVLNLGNGRFALYAHLQPGSIRVKKGQRVRAGQVLGLLGSSGNSDLPHLHFQLMDTKHPQLADGLPYVFASFFMQGNVGSIDSMLEGKGITKQPVSKPDKRIKELPENLDVVSFP
jgi:hypothetical protein